MPPIPGHFIHTALILCLTTKPWKQPDCYLGFINAGTQIYGQLKHTPSGWFPRFMLKLT